MSDTLDLEKQTTDSLLFLFNFMPVETDFLASLNSSQRQAVQHFCGPLLVVAGAGSGKTRALTYRIAHLILNHNVNPENILAVTFTNKAAKEMKERIELIFAQRLAQQQAGQRLDLLPEHQQVKLRSRAYKEITKHLWIGTFHSLFARILRYDINKYQDPKGYQWTKNFTIYDESDAQSLVKNIATKELNIDDKKFNPRYLRYSISNAKNQGFYPEDVLNQQPNYRGRVISEVYQEYQARLAANNALDFDDLILIPARLFSQNESVLGYWHQQFQHILVDEYQDTNRIQYQLINLLATNGETNKQRLNWDNRSIFVVGDADQSIYSFRMADFTILLEFQEDFGDGLPDDDTRTMVKLEENYRSRENILEAANTLIENNSERIEKVLKPTRGYGEEIYCYRADNEIEEAKFVRNQILNLTRENPEISWGSFAILYRTNAQSRVLEEALRADIPYHIVGGLKFYDRKEIKDALAYLRLLTNPNDTVSLLRIINTPRRGIGQKTLDQLISASQELNVPLWEIISDETSVKTLAGRAAKSVNEFANLIKHYQANVDQLPAAEILDGLLDNSNYRQDLQNQGTEEAENRLENLKELDSAMMQFAEENEDSSLESFLANASLASDLDNLNEGEEKVSLMTLHSAKGLEFPVVFLVGLEQGLFPNRRTLDDPAALEEERRLCYVGITRAQEQLFLSHAEERRLWGSREPAIPSQFLQELPEDLVNHNTPPIKPRRERSATPNQSQQSSQNWEVGDRVFHDTFGEGTITHLLGSGERTNLAIQFPGVGRKIIDPRIASLQRL